MSQRGLEVQFFRLERVDQTLSDSAGNAVNVVCSCQDGTTISLSMTMELAEKLQADIASAIRSMHDPNPDH